MNFDAIKEEQWGSLTGCSGKAAAIRAKSESLVKRLSSLFCEEGHRESVDISISASDSAAGAVLALVSSPLGRGRLRQGWTIANGTLAGIILVDREELGPDGQSLWRNVWGITVPEYDNPYVGMGQERMQIYLDRHFGADLRNSLFAFGMSILHAIAITPEA
ncbi:hypothetical protein ACLQ9F_14255 [Bordetella avium]|uniref:hypothetical protein n=1 Tax=Bordetella avium TaxID=521 RepID=UPI000E0C04DA|nr:hypothetical protein [Bordetella avium]UOK17003.1 hypothetical protein vBBaMIFTN1_01 [Bordetella phage vB_BaM-IFTN1]UOK17067.1 hypothetical protein vBBaMIFTN2_01 [Bordetella phage vB_BaM-IFTN2]UOK17130.1 hypothetical protein vBBaMIFTN3_01 [Bordetella phage vB_BaM-IFTN3]UOK17265.1 hypothetical protein vBBaMIFTN5_01 [Bordetella phage vB_BaM-IFTN5]UOK17334.1 hypothetical protein vBBaMIFTN6_01 [Bordetella phage vB_BaM-IFTN6]UOK17398.1 hypothetical protein vBBaMIFTN7_01 [Bordetella phage vB_BaM